MTSRRPRLDNRSQSPPQGPHSPRIAAQFGADFIPFELEFRVDQEIPGKRKHDEIDNSELDARQPKMARYEDGTFTTPWLQYLDPTLPKNSAEFFNQEVKAYAKYITPTPEENTLRALIVEEIQSVTRKLWSDAIATAFGSYATQLYLPTGDIDIVVQTSHVHTNSRNSSQSALTRLASALRSAGLAEKKKIQVIAARVPIIKFKSVHGGIEIDISLNQTTGIPAVKIIKRYLDYLPALRPLVIIIKSYLNQRGMNEVYKGGLGSYSIILMAISFLQMHPKIRLGEIDPFENLGVLLVEFFEFYGSFFNYNNLGMSINKGGSYFPKAQRGWQDLMKPWMLSISDPADETNDVSRGSFQMLRLRQTLGGAALILKARLLEVSGQIQSIQDGYYYRLRPAEPIQTVLGRLVAISPETIRRRIAIQDAFDSRKIHISLSIPFPSFIGVEGEHPEKSDMEVSDREGSSRVQPSSPSRSRTLPKDTHRLSEDEGENEEDDDEVKEHDSDGAAEESRYASTKPNAKASSSTSRNLLNRFDSDKVTQFVMSSSDDGEEGSLAEEGEEQMAISHARKKRKIEESTVQPGVIRRSSKRAYWAGKVNPE